MKLTTPLSLLASAAALGLALHATAPAGQADTAAGVAKHAIDPSHSTISFRCKHAGVSWAQGRFNEFSGEFTLDPENLDEAKVSFTIQAESVDTNSEDRDKHLRNSDFFTVKQFPTIEFSSDTVSMVDEDTYAVAGTVNWMGKEVELETEIHHVGSGEFRGPVNGYTTEFVLKRSDFGMDYGTESGTLGDEVFVRIDAEAR